MTRHPSRTASPAPRLTSGALALKGFVTNDAPAKCKLAHRLADSRSPRSCSLLEPRSHRESPTPLRQLLS